MNPYTYTVTLRIKHPSKNLEMFSKLIGKIDSAFCVQVNSVGEDRYTVTGEKLEGVHRESFYRLKFSDQKISSDTQSLPSYLSNLLQIIEPFSDLIYGVIQSGGSVSLFIGIFIDGNCGEVFDVLLLRRLSEQGISLEFDMYPPDHTQSFSSSVIQ